MIDILMACYNNESHIREQLDSILNQTETGWTLYIRDDDSKDRTWEILSEYQRRYPEKIHIFRNPENSGSARENFFLLMAQSRSPYFMLADGDDVWHPDKILMSMIGMKSLEAKKRPDRPLLIHTDLAVVDRNLKVISPSFMKYSRLNPKRNRLNHLLVQNIVSGNTCLGNRPLRNIVLQGLEKLHPEHRDPIMMHDWWLALSAAAFGAIGYMDFASVYYRQHGKNVVGAVNAESTLYPFVQWKNKERFKKALSTKNEQARLFFNTYQSFLSLEKKIVLEQFVRLSEARGKCSKIATLIRYDFLMENTVRQLGQFLFI